MHKINPAGVIIVGMLAGAGIFLMVRQVLLVFQPMAQFWFGLGMLLLALFCFGMSYFEE